VGLVGVGLVGVGSEGIAVVDDTLDAELAEHRHGRVPRDLRRRQVVSVATELFAEVGFAGASMDELARRVGVSKPVIYDLVGSKEQLFTIVTDSFARELGDRIVAAVVDADEPRAQFRAGAVAFFGFVAEQRDAWATLGATGTGTVHEGLDEIRRRQAELVALLLAEWFRRTAGDADPTDVDLAAHTVNGAFEAAAAWWRDHPDRSPTELASFVTDLVVPGLDALAVRRP
jgi:AcrR family transcriptional regulator